jgi:hypothetical protein
LFPRRCDTAEIPWHPREGHSGALSEPVGSHHERSGELKRRIRLTVFVAITSIAEIAFAVQIRTWHGRGQPWPDYLRNKVFVASWLESEMWIDPSLLMAGVSTMIVAVVTFFVYPRLADRRRAEAGA